MVLAHSHNLGEIGEGVEEGYGPRPLRHAADGGEDTAHQDEDDDDEEYHKHRLLHRAGVVGDDQAQAGEAEDEEQRQAVEQKDAAFRTQTVKQPGDQHADTEDDDADDPVRNELTYDEGNLRDGGDVDLLDGAGLLLTDDVHSREETGDKGHDEHDQGRDHGYLVVHRGVEPVVGVHGYASGSRQRHGPAL